MYPKHIGCYPGTELNISINAIMFMDNKRYYSAFTFNGWNYLPETNPSEKPIWDAPNSEIL